MRQKYVMGLAKKQLANIKGKSVLEVGVGDGYLISGLARDKAVDCIGVDISEGNIRVCNKELGKANLRFEVIDESGIWPFADGQFDLVVMTEVLEHMPDKELSRSVAELRRVLRTGGRAVISFPSNENLGDNECKCPGCGLVFHKVGHKQSWNRQKIKATFAEFKVLTLRERFWRWRGKSFMEKCGGLAMWLLRTMALNFGHRLSIPTWLIVIEK